MARDRALLLLAQGQLPGEGLEHLPARCVLRRERVDRRRLLGEPVAVAPGVEVALALPVAAAGQELPGRQGGAVGRAVGRRVEPRRDAHEDRSEDLGRRRAAVLGRLGGVEGLLHDRDLARAAVGGPGPGAPGLDPEAGVVGRALEDEERGERRHDPLALAEGDHLLGVRGRVLGEEALDLEAGPGPRQVAGRGGRRGERDGVAEGGAAARPDDGHVLGGRVVGLEAEDAPQLLAGLEVADVRAEGPPVGGLDPGLEDARGVEGRDRVEGRPRQVLVGVDLRREAPGPGGGGRHERPGPAPPDGEADVGRAGRGPLGQGLRVALAHDRDPGPQVDEGRRLEAGRDLGGRVEGPADVHGPEQVDPLEPLEGGRDALGRGPDRRPLDRDRPVAGRQDREGVVVAGVLQDRPHELDLRPGQERVAVARGLEQEDPVAARAPRRGLEVAPVADEEEALSAALVEGRPDGAVRGGPGLGAEREDDVAVRGHALGLGRDDEVPPGRLGREVVGRARPDPAGGALDAGPERPLPDRREAVAGREAVGRPAARGRQLLGVGEDDPLLPARLEGEHAHLEGRPVEPLEERRVAAGVADRLVDVAGPAPLGDPAFHQGPVHVHGEAGDRGVGREGEVEGPLEPVGRLVEVGLVDRRPGEAVLDVDVDRVAAEREAHVLSRRVDGDEGAAGVVARRDEGRGHRGPEVARPGQGLRGRRAGRRETAASVASRTCPAATASATPETATAPWVTRRRVAVAVARTASLVPRAESSRLGVATWKVAPSAPAGRGATSR